MIGHYSGNNGDDGDDNGVGDDGVSVIVTSQFAL